MFRPFLRLSRAPYSNQDVAVENIVSPEEARNFVQRCMVAVGTHQDHADSLAELLVVADQRGHYSHGLNRLEMYVNDVRSKTTRTDVEPKIAKHTEATALVDGKNALGPVIGRLCMDTAINKAKNTGIGWVVCSKSNHYGIAGWYAIRAADQGLIGMSFTNTSPFTFPTRSKEAALGTNPIAFAAPGKDGDHFVLDMATTAVAVGKVEVNLRKGVPIPSSWGVDSKGIETLDPQSVMNGGGLLPLGGTEISSGYKGYGLATMVEVFCGILAGAAYGPNIRQWLSDDKEANLGQCFVAINPEMFAPGFKDRLADLMKILRTLQPAEGESEVLVAGDPERRHMEKVDRLGGIPYHPTFITALDNLAEQLDVEKISYRKL